MQWFLQDISIGDNLKILRERFGDSQSESMCDFLALKQIYGVDFSEFFSGLLPDDGK